MANKDGFADDFAGIDRDFMQAAKMTEAFETELARLRKSMLLTSREVSTLSSGIDGGLRRAFEGLSFDGLSLKDAMKEVARSISDTVYAIAMKPVTQAVSGSLAQGLTNIVSGALPFADGGAFSQGRVMPFAKGGVVSQPSYFPMRGGTGLMGEAGPEAIMPLARGADGRLGVAAQGSARPVTVNMTIQTPDVAGFQRSRNQIAAELSRAISRGGRHM